MPVRLKYWDLASLTHPDRELTPVVSLLLHGGLVVFPTETLYGLGAFPFSRVALERIYACKRRARAKPLPLIADCPESVRRVTRSWPKAAERLAEAFWPGPLSLVLDAEETLPNWIASGSGRIAVRVSSHPLARALAARLGGLIVATSANRSGEPAVRDPRRLPPKLLAEIDGMVTQGEIPERLPSTLVRVDSGAEGDRVTVLRAGAVALPAIEQAAAGAKRVDAAACKEAQAKRSAVPNGAIK